MKARPLEKTDRYWAGADQGKRLAKAVFFTVLIAELIGAYILIYKNNYIMVDALARTASAYYVRHVPPYKLASIGFIWNPLPSVLQMPLLELSGLWRPLATHGIAGCIVTAFFAAFNAAYLALCLRRAAVSVFWTLTLTGLYAFNPFIFYYGCNGMSEAYIFTTLIVSTISLFRWMEERKTADLLRIAATLAFGFFCRYEAIPIGFAIALAFFIIIFLLPDPNSSFTKKSFGMKFHYYVATGVITFLPLAYAILLWLFFNWTIMGDPFYFQNSIYSNNAQTTEIQNIGMILAGMKMLPFTYPLLVITFQRLVRKKLFKWDFSMLILLVGIATGFHFGMLYLGKSYGWLRFFCFALPISVAWLPYELPKLTGFYKRTVPALLAVALFVSGNTLLGYFTNPEMGLEEYGSIVQTDYNLVPRQIQAAGRINESYSDGLLLLDSAKASALILNLDHPENLIINSSDGYGTIMKSPWNYGVRYVLVTAPEESGHILDDFAMVHPGLYENGADWCRELEDLGIYKIFEVIY